MSLNDQYSLRLPLHCGESGDLSVHKDDALWADEADQKNADAMSTDDNGDDLDDDAEYCVILCLIVYRVLEALLLMPR